MNTNKDCKDFKKSLEKSFRHSRKTRHSLIDYPYKNARVDDPFKTKESIWVEEKITNIKSAEDLILSASGRRFTDESK